MSNTATPTLDASAPRPGRLWMALVGLVASAALGGAILLATGNDDPGTAATDRAVVAAPSSASSREIDPRPEINQRQAAEQFHHGLSVSSAAPSSPQVDLHPEINQPKAAERFHHSR